MNALLPEDEDYIGRFIESLAFRNRSTVRVYRCILRGFVRFGRNAPVKACPVETLRSWLKDRANHWPSHLVEHRAWIVRRFLSWMKHCGYTEDNPFEVLEQHYGTETAPIVRALLSADSETALKKLHPRARFCSSLGPQMREYIDLMRSLGHRYDEAEYQLDRFDQFLQTRVDLVDQPLPVLIDAYRQVRSSVRHALEVRRCGRMLSKAAHRHDPTQALIPTNRQLERQTFGLAYPYRRGQGRLATAPLCFSSTGARLCEQTVDSADRECGFE